MYKRTVFNLSGAASAFTDTGPSLYGEFVGFRWYPTTADTGGDLALEQLINGPDTGEMYQFYNNNDCLGVPFSNALRQAVFHADGFDTGAADNMAPIVFAGEPLRVRVTPGGAAVAGRLYVYTRD